MGKSAPQQMTPYARREPWPPPTTPDPPTVPTPPAVPAPTPLLADPEPEEREILAQQAEEDARKAARRAGRRKAEPESLLAAGRTGTYLDSSSIK